MRKTSTLFFILLILANLQLISQETESIQFKSIDQKLASHAEASLHHYSFGTSIGYLFNHSNVNLFSGIKNIELRASSPQLAPIINFSYRYSIAGQLDLGAEIFCVSPLSDGHLTSDITDIFFEKKPLVSFSFTFSRKLNELSSFTISTGALATRVVISSKEKKSAETISNFKDFLISPQISLQLRTQLSNYSLSMNCTYVRDLTRERAFNLSNNTHSFCDAENCSINWKASLFSLTLSLPL